MLSFFEGKKKDKIGFLLISVSVLVVFYFILFYFSSFLSFLFLVLSVSPFLFRPFVHSRGYE